MSEQNPEQGHQDPAETNQVDTAVETADQPEAPSASGAVEVSPADPAVKTDNVLGKEYEVSPDRGYRVVQPPAPQGQQADEDSSDSES